MPDWRDLRIWALVAPVVLVAVFALWALDPLSGDTIVLETRGVDPPDLFRGDYVQLAYPIADIATEDLPEGGPWREGSTLYLVLAPGAREDLGGAPIWETQRVTAQKPQLASGELCMRATVSSASTGGAHVTLGIEAYFIAKDEDMREWQDKEVTVEVKVKDCSARLSAIRLDGERWAG